MLLQLCSKTKWAKNGTGMFITCALAMRLSSELKYWNYICFPIFSISFASFYGLRVYFLVCYQADVPLISCYSRKCIPKGPSRLYTRSACLAV